MTYYELFGLKPLLNLDLRRLESSYHELSRIHHPDFHTTSPPAEKAKALEMTALLNDAYRTLRDPTKRAEYLVRSEGLTVDSSKVPQELLMEVFEINEGLDELRTARKAGEDTAALEDELESFRAKIAGKRESYWTHLGQAFAEWDELVERGAPEQARRAQLARLADVISRESYIRNLEAELNDEVSH
jgi:molecular chaperone HscB